jgi:galactokinase
MMSQPDRAAQMRRRFVETYRQEPTVWVQAPGRVDLMGSHTDYNEGYVLTMTIDRNTWIAAHPRPDRRVSIGSFNIEGNGEFSLDDLGRDQAVPWTNYVRGVAAIFQAAGHELSGFNGLIHSTVPFSSGLSSSAALEVAAGMLFKTLGGWAMDAVDMARLCQKAENEFVGVNCGILDQYTSAVGQAGHAVLLDCRRLTSQAVSIHPSVQVVICDTQARRALSGSEYPERRAACEQGAAYLAGQIPGVRTLRDVTLDQLAAHRNDLPETVFRRARFIIEENQRVLALAGALPEGDEAAIHRLTAASFAGARDLYEISIPAMESMMAAMLSGPGVIGARQAGAGFGGCMVAFVKRPYVDDFTQHVTTSYTAATQTPPKVYPVAAAPGAGTLPLSSRARSPDVDAG